MDLPAKMQSEAQVNGLARPLPLKYREALTEAIGMVVRNGKPDSEVLAVLGLPIEDATKFQQLLTQELKTLAAHNCARYRLGMRETQAWMDEGRPGVG